MDLSKGKNLNMKYLVYLAYLVTVFGLLCSTFSQSADAETNQLVNSHDTVSVRLLARFSKKKKKGGKKGGKKKKKEGGGGAKGDEVGGNYDKGGVDGGEKEDDAGTDAGKGAGAGGDARRRR